MLHNAEVLRSIDTVYLTGDGRANMAREAKQLHAVKQRFTKTDNDQFSEPKINRC